jgi:drug/metabolite transporter (DMT)-like permease
MCQLPVGAGQPRESRILMTAATPSRPALDKFTYMRGALCGIAAVSIWAGWMAVTRIGVTTTLNAWDIAALRFGLAGLVLLPVVWRKGLALRALGWPRLILLVSGAGAPYALVAAQGLRFASAADAGALIPGVMPLFVALLASVCLGESFIAQRRDGFVLIFAGIVCIAGASLMAGNLVRSCGHALFLGAALLWACFTIVMRWAKLEPLHATALVSVGSLIGYVPAYLLIAGNHLLDAPLADIAVQALYQGVLTTVVSLTLFGRAVAILGASGGAAFGALVPAMAALIAIPLLGELPSRADWIGIPVISIGVYLASGGPLPDRLRRIGG